MATTRDVAWTEDELILACALVADAGWKQLDDSDPRIQALSDLLQLGPIPVEDRTPKFRNPNGVARKTADIATVHPDYTGKPTRGGRLDKVVLDEFLADPAGMRAKADAVRAAFLSREFVGVGVEDDTVDVGSSEGGVLFRQHAVRERDPKLRKRKLDSVRESGQPLACEVCGLQPSVLYPGVEASDSLFDVHHVVPLSVSGVTTTRLADLAVLCPSCHRAIHASRPWATPKQLREQLPRGAIR